MPNTFLYADEAGCFTFKKRDGASRYFILGSIITEDADQFAPLLRLRRELQIAGEPDRMKLHATTDSQAVRNEVYSILSSCKFKADFTILEKDKAQPQTRESDVTFYKYAWYYHFKHIGPKRCFSYDKSLITAASLGTKKTKASFKAAVNNAVQQVLPRNKWEVCFPQSSEEPLLWVADYATWAVQRKWEREDTRSYELISDKIETEFDLWSRGTRRYY